MQAKGPRQGPTQGFNLFQMSGKQSLGIGTLDPPSKVGLMSVPKVEPHGNQRFFFLAKFSYFSTKKLRNLWNFFVFSIVNFG